MYKKLHRLFLLREKQKEHTCTHARPHGPFVRACLFLSSTLCPLLPIACSRGHLLLAQASIPHIWQKPGRTLHVPKYWAESDLLRMCWEYLGIFGKLTVRVRRAFPINIWEHLRICGNSWHEGLVGHILECSGILGNVWECLRATPWRPAIGPSRAPTDTHTGPAPWDHPQAPPEPLRAPP